MAELPREDFVNMAKRFPFTIKVMKKHMRKYNDRQKQFTRNLLEMVPYFSGLQSKQLEELIYKLETVVFEAGDYVWLPGDVTNDIYFVIS